MGEAKRRRAEESSLVWHHTSILRTNRIWMTGVIELEGRSAGVEHPAFGEVFTSATMRRALIDFPALAWFTSNLEVPKCLQHFDVHGKDRRTGEPKVIELGPDAAAAFALNRVALGFPIAATPVCPWPDHYGYLTNEGRALNVSARDVGDEPDQWWVSEQPVDVMLATSFRASPSLMNTKLERQDGYIEDIRRMVTLCRKFPDTVIPPTWVGSAAHRALMKNGGDVSRWGPLGRTMSRQA